MGKLTPLLAVVLMLVADNTMATEQQPPPQPNGKKPVIEVQPLPPIDLQRRDDFLWPYFYGHNCLLHEPLRLCVPPLPPKQPDMEWPI